MRMREIINIIEARATKNRPTSDQIDDIRKKRHEIRSEEGSGGQCGWVAEYCMDKYGWPMIGGTYCNDADEPVCCDHVWNQLPDGAIFDPTADQMGLGFDMRIVELTDPDYKKYRLQWTEEFNPDLADEIPELKGQSWSGKYDNECANELRAQRGRHWYVTDKKQHKEYRKLKKSYETNYRAPKKPFSP